MIRGTGPHGRIGNARVTASAIHGVGFPGVRAVTRTAGLEPMLAEASVHGRQRVTACMAPGRRARLECALRRRLFMRVVAASALPAVRLVVRGKPTEPLPHGVASETLLVPRGERRTGRVDRISLGGRDGELVADHAMQVGLLRHFSEFDFHVVMTSGLRAGFADGFESMHLLTMTGDALDLGHHRRPRIQVHLVPRRRRDALPGAVRIALNVAL